MAASVVKTGKKKQDILRKDTQRIFLLKRNGTRKTSNCKLFNGSVF